jgi:hypothetical protein
VQRAHHKSLSAVTRELETTLPAVVALMREDSGKGVSALDKVMGLWRKGAMLTAEALQRAAQLQPSASASASASAAAAPAAAAASRTAVSFMRAM